MATKTGIKVTRGGSKGHEWVRYFIPASIDTTPKAAKPRGAKRAGVTVGPRATSTIIPNSTNPQLSVYADDTVVQGGGVPLNNPTVAAGSATASIAGAVIADTGAMPAGTYKLEVRMGGSVVRTAGKHLQVEHRNAANAATINMLGLSPGEPFCAETDRIVLALNERIRVVVGAVAIGAGEVVHALIRVYLLKV